MPANRKTFRKFFKLKQQLNENKNKPSLEQILHSNLSSPKQNEYFFNIKEANTDQEWVKLRLFVGEQGKFIQCANELVLYVGGFKGNQFNLTVAEFIANSFHIRFSKLNYPFSENTPAAYTLGRVGATVFWDSS